MARRHMLLWLLLILALVRGLTYVAVIPPWQIPDEPYHFLSAHLPLIDKGDAGAVQLETLKTETMESMLSFHFWERVSGTRSVSTMAEASRLLPNGFQFAADTEPRSYTYYALAAWLAPVVHLPVTAQLYWGRLLSVVALLAVVALAYGTGQLLFGNELFTSALMPLIVLWQPPHTVLFAGINDGIPAEFLASAAICVWLWGVMQGWRWFKVLAMVVLIVLAITAKASNLFLAIAVPVWLLIRYRRLLFGRRNLPVTLAALALIGGAALASQYVVKSYLAGLWRVADGLLGGASITEYQLPSLEGFYATFRNFWTTLGWNTLQMSRPWGELWLVLCVVALLGLLRLEITRVLRRSRAIHRREEKSPAMVVLILCVLGGVVTSVGFVVATGNPGSQGRYLFSVMVPIAALLALGWRQWVPTGWRLPALAMAVSSLFLFDVVALLLYAVPFFYPIWS